MKTGEVAERLGVSRQTVRNWKDEWAKYLSPGLSNSAKGVPLVFSDRDVMVLATVAACKEQQFSNEEIRAVLDKGDEHLVNIPPMPSPAEQAARAKVQLIPVSEYRREIMTLTAERDRLIGERDKYERLYRDTVDQMGELKQQLGVLQGELDSRQRDDEEVKALHEEIVKLNREIAKLEVLLEMEQKKHAG
jgi:DNA-binding transcriptional MerR regulator